MTFRVSGESGWLDAETLADALYRDLSTFKSLEPNSSQVEQVGDYFKFTIKSFTGLLSAVPNAYHFGVRLFKDKAARTNRAVTLGGHPLVGIRKWQVEVEDIGSCNYNVTVMTVGAEQSRTIFNEIGRDWLGGEGAQAALWDNYFTNLQTNYGTFPGVVATGLARTTSKTFQVPSAKANPFRSEIPAYFR